MAGGDDVTPAAGEGGQPRRLSHNELEMARQYSETSARIDTAIEKKKAGKKPTAAEATNDLKKEMEMWEHKVTVAELESKLGTNVANGLTKDDHKMRLERDGPNMLSPPKVKPWWYKLLMQFLNFFALLLQVASIMSFVGYALDQSSPDNLYLGVVLYVVVIITALFTFMQEFKSEKTMEKFANFLPPQTVARRGGLASQVDASTLVVGDVIEVKLGDKIPADIRLVENAKLKVDNSSLTGESEPQKRTVECTDENPLESKNLAFFGTLAVDGTAVGVVVNTGDRTVFGRIAGLAAGSDAQATTLQLEIHRFVIIISAVAITLGLIFLVIGFVKGTDIIDNLIFVIGIIVANVPEGLLATVTVSLTLTAKRMAKKNVLVKKLECVETLGSTTTICSDKTGTLTQNRMTIVHAVTDMTIHTTKTATQESTFDFDSPTFKNLFMLACVCAKAKFDAADMAENPDKSVDDRQVNGDASEAGILKWAEKLSPVMPIREKNEQVATIPFNSANKFMVTINKDSVRSDNGLRLCMKGAPERVLDRCSNIMIDGETRAMSEADKATINERLQTLMEGGERVLGFAQMSLDVEAFPASFEFDTENPNFPLEGMTFVGLLALLDPPRESVPSSIRTCQTAGVQVIMVTGDHPATAKSIAKQVNIITDKTAEDVAKERGVAVSDVDPTTVKAIVVPGSQIRDLDESDWDRVLAHEQIVFARTSPQQKLIIVENCQRLAKIVAVTGDGVNDSPALKRANIGVAMGIAGSDVSKEAADMILLDDNFSSIVSGIEEGRLIFDNLKKSIAYTLSSNIPEISPFLAFILTGIPQPLTTVLILCIDLGTDMLPAISLAYEKAESDIMLREPRNAAVDRLVTRRLISFSYLQIGITQAAAGFMVYLIVFQDYGISTSLLPGLDNDRLYAAKADEDKRWLYTELVRPRGESVEREWFDRGSNSDLARFFASAQPGFVQQTAERFGDLLPGNGAGGRPVNAQFNNMVKIIQSLTQLEPCVEYQCDIGGVSQTNNAACFTSPDPVFLTGINNLNANTNAGQCFELWSREQQSKVLRRAQTAFFISIIEVQWADVLICKTRYLSLFQQGFFSNLVLNAGLLEETLLGALLVYVPFLHGPFGTQPLRAVHWLPALPFVVIIFTYDEVRKFLLRLGKTKGNKFGMWLYDNTYW